MLGRKYGGRKAGTPNKMSAEISALARQYAPQAIATLVGLMRASRSEKVRMTAAELLLDRGYGRVAQAIAGPLVNVNVGLPPPGARPLSPEEAYRYVVSGALPREEERILVDQLQEAARRPALEHNSAASSVNGTARESAGAAPEDAGRSRSAAEAPT